MSGKKKKTAGLTLIEVLIAIGIISIIAAPLLSMFVTGTRITTASYKLTVAAVTAQMRMEELVGLTQSELEDEVDGSVVVYNGFEVSVSKTERSVSYPLVEVEVTVYDGTQVLYTLLNILNVAPGGIAEVLDET